MKRLFQQGLRLLATSPAVAVPVIIFVLLERTLQSQGALLNYYSDIFLQLFRLVTHPLILTGLGLSFAIKLMSVFFSNADMYLAMTRPHGRYRQIFSTFSFKDLSFLLLLAFLWTSGFCILGIAVIFAARQLLTQVGALLVAGIIGIPLFPIFYVGLSLGSLVFIISKLDHIPTRVLLSRAAEQKWRIYKYYALRSALDSTILFGVPAIWLMITNSVLVGAIGTFFCAVPFITYVRATFIVFKRDVLIGSLGLSVRSGSLNS